MSQPGKYIDLHASNKKNHLKHISSQKTVYLKKKKKIASPNSMQ